MVTVHPEPEFSVIMTPVAPVASLKELKLLRELDAIARDISISDLKKKILDAGSWTISSLAYEEVSEVKERIEGSSWKLNVESA